MLYQLTEPAVTVEKVTGTESRNIEINTTATTIIVLTS